MRDDNPCLCGRLDSACHFGSNRGARYRLNFGRDSVPPLLPGYARNQPQPVWLPELSRPRRRHLDTLMIGPQLLPIVRVPAGGIAQGRTQALVRIGYPVC